MLRGVAHAQPLRALVSFVVTALIALGCVSVYTGGSNSPEASARTTAESSAQAGASLPTGAPVITPQAPERTKKPKHTPAPAPTGTGPSTATATPTATATTNPTPTSTAQRSFHIPIGSLRIPISSSILLPPPPRLDYTAAANYGEANLSVGFAPDPYGVGMTTGGPVDVSYLGGACTGFATSAPDLRINFGGGSALLRLYFLGITGDAAMVVNDPYGNFYCVDDSFGTVNPTIDFNDPAGGTYDVWICTYVGNTTVGGTFYTTENSGNHP